MRKTSEQGELQDSSTWYEWLLMDTIVSRNRDECMQLPEYLW